MEKKLSFALLLVLLMAITLTSLASGGLVVTSDVAIAIPEDNFYKVAGIITNQGKKAVDLGWPEVALKDKAGKPLKNGSHMAQPDRLEPGESAYFVVSFLDLDSQTLSAITSHEITLPKEKGEDIGQLTALPVEVTSALDQLNEETGITAEFTNNTGAEISRLRVVWILRDAAGQLIDISSFSSRFNEPVADGAKQVSNYHFGFMGPTLAYCLEKGLAEGSAECHIFSVR